MKANAGLLLAVLLVALLALGSFLGRDLTHVRQSEAFYRWIVAAATNERLFQDTSDEYRDHALFQDVVALAGDRLPDVVTVDTEDSAPLSTLAQAIADPDHDWDVWQLASSADLEQERTRFLDYARNRELQFATGIAYADAQASGVNIFNLFFGFRKLAANMVWLQVDRFWHQGMLHRMIPLMKSCVALDPNFVDAYLVGAWHIAYNATAKMLPTPVSLQEWHPRYNACLGPQELFYYVAIDFLKDGIRNNPRNYKLYFDLGYSIYSEKMRDYGNAVRYLREAVRVPHDRWVPRMLYRSLERNGQYEESLAGWQDYARRFPEAVSGSETAPRFMQRNRALIFEQRMNQAYREADGLTDPQARMEKLAEAEGYRNQARSAWEEIDDPFAESRLLLMEAEDLVRDNRVLEALALMDQARWGSAEVWDEASNRIIEVKQESNLPLSVSEQKAVLRDAEAAVDCLGKPASAS